MNEKLINFKKAARKLTVDVRTLKKWCQNGYVEYIELPDGRIRIPEKEIERILTRTTRKN